jgi:hypothetical protein
MPTSTWALQQAVYAELASDTALLALLGSARIYDDVPQGTAFPYITLGSATTRDWSTGSEAGDEHALTLHAWSRAGGRKEVQALVGAIHDALHDASLTLDGHRLVNLRHESSDSRREGDGDTYHGIARFRAVTEPL